MAIWNFIGILENHNQRHAKLNLDHQNILFLAQILTQYCYFSSNELQHPWGIYKNT